MKKTLRVAVLSATFALFAAPVFAGPGGNAPPPPPKHEETPKKTVEPLRDPAPAKPRRPFAALEIGGARVGKAQRVPPFLAHQRDDAMQRRVRA